MGYGKLSLNIDEIQILLQEHNLLKSSVSANQKNIVILVMILVM